MSETQHTPGLVDVPEGRTVIRARSGTVIAQTYVLDSCIEGIPSIGPGEAIANARRLAACWNACKGLSTEALEGEVVGDLLEACEAALDWFGNCDIDISNKLLAAIAKTKGTIQ